MGRLFLVALSAAALSCSTSSSGPAPEGRPNILWITAEDMSPVLGCYGDAFAITPNIDALSGRSVRYTRAFATAPVCSPSRSCLITGCYAPSLGTQQMRSAFPIPREMTGFPSILRKLGYYTSNNVKTDYNTGNHAEIVKASWNESSAQAHWRKRGDAKQPFFSVFNLMTAHQSRAMVWPYEKFRAEVQSKLAPSEIHDPAKVPLPPYYPDTPVIRKTVARFYDCVTAMDKEVGAILDQLEADGLADDTIVFFYSDHGSGMPRHKRALLDSGMHVPLLVRFPEKYRAWAPAGAGKTLDRLVSFVDFGPTVLSLAGAEIPGFMQGRPFLGPEDTTPRKYVFGHRDRVDEVRDLARSVRDKRWLYIRNYMPHLGYNQQTAWPDLGEIRHEFYRATDRARMTDAQYHFAGPTRPVEELYDCEKDPLNLVNLAGSENHSGTLQRMRDILGLHLRTSRDLGFIPESEAWKMTKGTTPWELARSGGVDLEGLLLAAEHVGWADEDAFLADLEAVNAGVRYWAAIGLAASGRISADAKAKLAGVLEDPSGAVRIEAANALAAHGDVARALPVLTKLLEDADLSTVLHAARTIEMLGGKAREAIPAMEMVAARALKIRPADTPATVVNVGDVDTAMFIGFAANGFLSRVKGERGPNGAEEWTPLFDGKTLDGWEVCAKGEVTVEEGEIRILSKGANLWLVHEGVFEDFELQVEVLMPAKGYNSGVGFRCTGKGKPKGYQCEVENAKTGMIYAIGSGWVWPKGKEESAKFNEMAKGAFKVGEWNRLRILAEGEHLRIWVNDTLTADVQDKRFASGSVALQHHGKGDVHRFRNIRIRKVTK